MKLKILHVQGDNGFRKLRAIFTFCKGFFSFWVSKKTENKNGMSLLNEYDNLAKFQFVKNMSERWKI